MCWDRARPHAMRITEPLTHRLLHVPSMARRLLTERPLHIHNNLPDLSLDVNFRLSNGGMDMRRWSLDLLTNNFNTCGRCCLEISRFLQLHSLFQAFLLLHPVCMLCLQGCHHPLILLTSADSQRLC